MRIADWKIGARLAALAGILLVAIVVVGIQGFLAVRDTNRMAERAIQRAELMDEAIDTARYAQVQFKTQIQEWKNILLRGQDQAAFDKHRQAFVKEGDGARASLAKLTGMLKKAEIDAGPAEETHKALAELQARYLAALQQYDPANKDSASVVDGAVRGMDRAPNEKMNVLVATMIEKARAGSAAALQEQSAEYRKANILLGIDILLALAFGVATTLWLTRSITRPIGEAVQVARSVASGDLTSRIEVTSRDETGQLMEALRDMNDSLSRIVAEVRSGTESIASASSQIASGNMDLSSRTEAQASSLEETASSMEELTSTVKQNADNARQANTLAASASQVASKGGDVVAEVVSTMDAIHESSKKIVDIISVIDGIAFQTNILALNAAVEAARAGEQGRGFAVVAAEVRNLAQRSAAAAREIKSLIETSVDKVDSGSRLVNQAGATMYEIVESVRRVTDIIAEISAASQEQTAGIEQINEAVTQMDDMIQQNASLVEQAAAAAQAMHDQANRLAGAVGVFKVDQALMAQFHAAAAGVVSGHVPAMAGAGVPRVRSRTPRLR